jgi:hypothetical protein
MFTAVRLGGPTFHLEETYCQAETSASHLRQLLTATTAAGVKAVLGGDA